MKKNSVILILSFLTGFIILLQLKSQYYHLKQKPPLEESRKDLLRTLAVQSLEANDVPIAALLIFNERIIGEGYNTVSRDLSAAGHAEINAISDALKKFGIEEFAKLNRDSLVMLTTFEPCPMCRGAIEEYKIKNIEFIKEKPTSYWLKNSFGELLYELRKRKIGNETLQDDLFNLHPNYTEGK